MLQSASLKNAVVLLTGNGHACNDYTRSGLTVVNMRLSTPDETPQGLARVEPMPVPVSTAMQTL
ncbi:hypothetical protein ABBQ38_011418 [Trebouxia sp. C0009 RCD-2024]